MSIKDYLHTQIEFVNFDLSDKKQTGFVVDIEESDQTEEIDNVLIVKVEYGPHHGQLVRVFVFVFCVCVCCLCLCLLIVVVFVDRVCVCVC